MSSWNPPWASGPLGWNQPWSFRGRFGSIPTGRSVVYHASSNVFTNFDPAKSKLGGYGPGLYFAESPQDVKYYGLYRYAVTVDVSNPMLVSKNSPGPEIIGPLSKAAGMTAEDLEMFTSDGSHPIVSIMATLADEGVDQKSLIKFFQKRGHDSILVDPEIINHESPGSATGNYLVIFDPKSIISVTREMNR